MLRRHAPRTPADDARRRAREDGDGRCHWALLATPGVYDVEAGVAARPEGLWTTDGQPLAPGDRVLVWKALDRGWPPLRGVVALGEVLDRPTVRPDPSPFWADPTRGAEPRERATVRYDVPPGLPLWIGRDDRQDAVLRALTVSRGQGRTVFHVTPEQWRAVADLAGWQGRLLADDARMVAEDVPPAFDASVAWAVAVASVRGFYASLGHAVTRDPDDPRRLLAQGPAGPARRVVVRVAPRAGDWRRAVAADLPHRPAAGATALFVVADDGSGRLLFAMDPWDGRLPDPGGGVEDGPDAP